MKDKHAAVYESYSNASFLFMELMNKRKKNRRSKKVYSELLNIIS